jgi:DNA-binding transcriptional regulator YdaS (Cro superfamily)
MVIRQAVGRGKTDYRALLEAIERAGSLAKLAQQLGISKQAIHKWRRAPAERIVEIERVTGVERERLRPDLYRVPQHVSR